MLSAFDNQRFPKERGKDSLALKPVATHVATPEHYKQGSPGPSKGRQGFSFEGFDDHDNSLHRRRGNQASLAVLTDPTIVNTDQAARQKN